MKKHLKRFIQIGLPILGAVAAGLAGHKLGSRSGYAAGDAAGYTDGLHAGREENRSWMQGLFRNYANEVGGLAPQETTM